MVQGFRHQTPATVRSLIVAAAQKPRTMSGACELGCPQSRATDGGMID